MCVVNKKLASSLYSQCMCVYLLRNPQNYPKTTVWSVNFPKWKLLTHFFLRVPGTEDITAKLTFSCELTYCALNIAVVVTMLYICNKAKRYSFIKPTNLLSIIKNHK